MESIDSTAYGLGIPAVPAVPIVPRRSEEPSASRGQRRYQLADAIRAALAKPQAADVSLGEVAAGIGQSVPGIHAVVFFPGAPSILQALPGTGMYCAEEQVGLTGRWSAALQQIAREAIEKKRFASGIVRSGPASLMAVVNPIVAHEEIVGAIGMVGETANSRSLANTMNLVTSEVGRWREGNPVTAATNSQPVTHARSPTVASGGPTANAIHAETRQQIGDSKVSAEVLKRLVAQPDLESAARLLADDFAQRFGFEKVFIGFRNRNGEHSQLLAISDVPKFSAKSPLTLAAEETLSESLIRDKIVWGNVRQGSESMTSGSREIARLCNESVVASGPIGKANQRVWGGWVGVCANEPRDPNVLGTIDEYVQQIAPCMELFDRARGGRLSNAYRRCRDWIKTKKGAVVLLAIVACGMLIPLPYNVKCDSELQPLTRRFIPVPHDGVLQEVLVEPGDEVQAGQVLARMDRREIEWELAAAKADYNQAAKQHDGDLAVRDTAAAQVDRLEMKSLQVQIELLNDRLGNLEIKCPIDGVIIGGDPKKKEGARLAQGDSLFEAGPLSKMVAELFVPDDEISRIREGQQIGLRLDAFPSRSWQGELVRISPSAEVRNQENVFVAEFEIDNPNHIFASGNARSKSHSD